MDIIEQLFSCLPDNYFMAQMTRMIKFSSIRIKICPKTVQIPIPLEGLSFTTWPAVEVPGPEKRESSFGFYLKRNRILPQTLNQTFAP